MTTGTKSNGLLTAYALPTETKNVFELFSGSADPNDDSDSDEASCIKITDVKGNCVELVSGADDATNSLTISQVDGNAITLNKDGVTIEDGSGNGTIMTSDGIVCECGN